MASAHAYLSSGAHASAHSGGRSRSSDAAADSSASGGGGRRSVRQHPQSLAALQVPGTVLHDVLLCISPSLVLLPGEVVPMPFDEHVLRGVLSAVRCFEGGGSSVDADVTGGAGSADRPFRHFASLYVDPRTDLCAPPSSSSSSSSSSSAPPGQRLGLLEALNGATTAWKQEQEEEENESEGGPWPWANVRLLSGHRGVFVGTLGLPLECPARESCDFGSGSGSDSSPSSTSAGAGATISDVTVTFRGGRRFQLLRVQRDGRCLRAAVRVLPDPPGGLSRSPGPGLRGYGCGGSGGGLGRSEFTHTQPQPQPHHQHQQRNPADSAPLALARPRLDVRSVARTAWMLYCQLNYHGGQEAGAAGTAAAAFQLQEGGVGIPWGPLQPHSTALQAESEPALFSWHFVRSLVLTAAQRQKLLETEDALARLYVCSEHASTAVRACASLCCVHCGRALCAQTQVCATCGGYVWIWSM